MDRATQRIRAKLDATITAYRLEGRKYNVDDVLADIELAEIAEARHKANGNGAEPPKVKCFCDEGIVSGRRVAVHRPCDCAYTAARGGAGVRGESDRNAKGWQSDRRQSGIRSDLEPYI